MESVYNEFNNIDINDWNSPEKTKLNNKFIPYLKKSSEKMKQNFNSKTTTLKDALYKYKENDIQLKKNANELEG